MTKKIKLISIIIFSLTLCFLSSCKKEKPPIVEPKDEYTLTYNANGGYFESNFSDTIEQTYEEGKRVAIIDEVPVKEGYVFVGWQNNGDLLESTTVKMTNDLELIAIWEEFTYSITYRASVGSFGNGKKEHTIKVKPGAIFTYGEIPSAEGRMFNGYFDKDGNIVLEGFEVTQDIEISAKYKIAGDEKQINFILNGGIMNEETNSTYNEGINRLFSTPTKEGFEFLGWFDNVELTGNRYLYQDTTAEGDKTYFASWKIVDVTKVTDLINELVPDVLTTNISMPSSYQGTTILWRTPRIENKPVVAQPVNNKGMICPSHTDEKAKIIAKVTINGSLYEVEKEVTVKGIVFDDIENPIAGYFYNTHLKNATDVTTRNLDIIYYAFAHVNSNGIISLQNKAQFEVLVEQGKTLRQNGTRIVLSIAGGAAAFSAACLSVGPSVVATNIVKYVFDYNLDGVDIDWEFPDNNTDASNLTTLCKSVKAKLKSKCSNESTPYLVTAAIPSSQLYTRFNLQSLNEVLDYVNMMSYDMNLAGLTTHLCPLLKANNDGNVGYGVDQGITYFTKAGLDKEKIIIGSAFYGKAYDVLAGGGKPQYPGLGLRASLKNMQYQSGTVTYSYIANNLLPNKDYVEYWDEEAKASYLFNAKDQIFITFENVRSIEAKVEFAYNEGVGIMFWEYGYDNNNTLTDAMCAKMEELKNN